MQTLSSILARWRHNIDLQTLSDNNNFRGSTDSLSDSMEIYKLSDHMLDGYNFITENQLL